jgi:hypothetical protein
MSIFFVTSKSTIFKDPKREAAEFINAKNADDARKEVASYRHTKKVLNVTKVTKKTLTPQMFRLALFAPRSDAEEILQHLVDAFLCAGVTKEAALPSLGSSVKRLLQLAASDIDLKVPTKLMNAQASILAEEIFDRVAVHDIDAVPPVNKRRGNTPGIAEKLAA